jgi:4-amino-4-deoxy-L-arabinose transferase-like glycosyltransferase
MNSDRSPARDLTAASARASSPATRVGRAQQSGNSADPHGAAGGAFARGLPATRRGRWLLALALCAIAILYFGPGIMGHDPWKQDETYSFGIVQSLLHGTDWIVPVNAGQPFMEKPPLYYWTAAGLAYALSSWLPLHDGARLASLLYGLAMFAWLIAWSVARERRIRLNAPAFPSGALRAHALPAHWQATLTTVALFGSTAMIIKHVHDMFTDVALASGAVCALYGLYRIAARLDTTGRATFADWVWLGIGTGIAQMSKGFFIPGVLALTVLALPLFTCACRSRHYATAIVGAALVSLPFFVLWPAFLAQRSPELFMTWFWDNNVGRFLGFSTGELGSANDSFVVARALLGGTFPCGLLALYAIARGGWRQVSEPETGVPLIFCVVGFALLSVSATARVLYVLPFVAPLAILACDGVRMLHRQVLRVWQWIGITLFSLAAALVWFEWWVMTGPVDSHGPARWLHKWLPLDYTIPFSHVSLTFALALTAAWMLACRTSDTLGSARAPVVWFAGMTLGWGLVFTLLLPWLNQAKSYGPVFRELSTAIAPAWRSGDCMASINLGESEAPMLEYFAGIIHRPASGTRLPPACRWLIVEDADGRNRPPDSGWQLVWQGSRQGDTREHLRVYQRPAQHE